jgi:hypothetical protein
MRKLSAAQAAARLGRTALDFICAKLGLVVVRTRLFVVVVRRSTAKSRGS